MSVSTLPVTSTWKDPNSVVKSKKLQFSNENDEESPSPRLQSKETTLNFKSDFKIVTLKGLSPAVITCVLLWQRVYSDTKTSPASIFSLTSITSLVLSFQPLAPGDPGDSGPGGPPHCGLPEQPLHRDPGDPGPGPDELPEQPHHDPAEPGPGPGGPPEQQHCRLPQRHDLNLLWSQWTGHPLFRYVLVLFSKIQAQDSPRPRLPTGPRTGYGYGSNYIVINFKQLMDTHFNIVIIS